MSSNTIAQLAAAEVLKNDIVEKTNNLWLEMLAMQSLVYKKKVLAETRIQEDKEDKLRRQADEDHRQALATLQAARQQRDLTINNTVMDKMAASQNEGRLSLADHDRMTQIMQQLNIDVSQYNKIINPEDDGNAELHLYRCCRTCGRQ